MGSDPLAIPFEQMLTLHKALTCTFICAPWFGVVLCFAPVHACMYVAEERFLASTCPPDSVIKVQHSDRTHNNNVHEVAPLAY